MALKVSKNHKLDWSDIDFENPKVQRIVKNMLSEIGSIRDQALVEIKRLSNERRGIIQQIEKRADNDKIRAILSKIK